MDAPRTSAPSRLPHRAGRPSISSIGRPEIRRGSRSAIVWSRLRLRLRFTRSSMSIGRLRRFRSWTGQNTAARSTRWCSNSTACRSRTACGDTGWTPQASRRISSRFILSTRWRSQGAGRRTILAWPRHWNSACVRSTPMGAGRGIRSTKDSTLLSGTLNSR